MFKNILVPVDLSAKNKKSLDIAVGLAMHDGANVHVLHVIETIADTTYSEFKDFYLKLERQAQQHLKKVIRPYQKQQTEIQSSVVFGNRLQEILKYSVRKKVNLIIMHSHKVNLKTPGEGWGTMSYKVGILSQCPVMLVK